MYQVDSEDAAFLFLENQDNPAHLGLLALYDQSALTGKGVRFQHIMQHMRNRLNSAPVFHQKIKRVPGNVDYPYWVEDGTFDLDYHVRHLALPKPGDWRQLCIQVSRLHSRPLDLRRPLWELYVIEGLDKVAKLPKGSFALYFKIHHCAMDEFTALELLESLHETIANELQHEHRATQIGHLPALEPGLPDMIAQAISGNILRGIKLSVQTVKQRRYVSRQLMKACMRALGRAPSITGSRSSEDEQQTRFAGFTSGARVFQGGVYPRSILDTFCAQVPGADMHHALAVICGEATRRYLEEKNEIEDTPLSARFQIDTRNAGAHALSGNKMALQHIELYTGISDLVERLYAVVGSNHPVSEDELEIRSQDIRAFYESLPAPLLSLIGRWSRSELRSLETGGSCGISTLQGPDQPVYFLGAKLAGLTSVSPLYRGCGLMYSASEYGDQIAISFTSGREMLPDPEKLMACLESTIGQISNQPLNAVVQAGGKGT